MIARNLNELVRAGKGALKLQGIALRASKDLICTNLMCEKVTQPCICRLELALQSVNNPESILFIDISGNALTSLPPSLSRFTELKFLDLSENAFKIKPPLVMKLETSCTKVDMSGNPVVKDD
jgi:hypothetical protein